MSGLKTHTLRLHSLIFTLCLAQSLHAINYPSPPEEPTVAQPQVEPSAKTSSQKKTRKSESVPQMNMRLRIHLGDKSVLMAEAQIPATYSFTHTKGQIQYNQTIRAEDIRELAIENYRARKIAGAKDGDVYEFEPATVRIELKDGQVFKLQYLFKDMRKLRARNSDGVFSVFAFFADTWNARAGWQERPSAGAGPAAEIGRPHLSRYAHPAAFTRLEYFEPVDKVGAQSEPGNGEITGPRK